ncbi:MAG: cysteine desulfurase NifS [Firmicutes bacterium]|nr:cysteine desulfurase NifS [Bacillota bacterium]
MQRTYMDHSATTPVHPDVVKEMLTVLTDNFGNPSSIHGFGRSAREAVEQARSQVADLIGAKSEEIIFTSGGTEADNLAIIGAAYAHRDRGRHLITSKIEHHAVLDTFKFLERQGFEVSFLPVDQYGQVSPELFKEAIRDDTILVSLMHANNEVGTIQPIAEIGRMTRERGILFHTDAVQTVGRIPVDVSSLGVDMLSLSAHKFYGPKGIGALYLRRRVKIQPLVHGGGQERKWRSGTENVPGIVGLGKAAELARDEMPQRNAKLTELGRTLAQRITSEIPDSILTGHPEQRIPGHVSACFAGVEGESMLIRLDMVGFAASSGSACTSGALEPSHVLLALGLSHEVAHGSLRLSLGKDNTMEDVDRLMQVLPEIVSGLRAMSPLYKK